MNYPPLVNVTTDDTPDIPIIPSPSLNCKHNNTVIDVNEQVVRVNPV